MKTTLMHSLTYLCLLCVPRMLFAQGFSSESNGSYGAMNITADATLDLPADGIFHCTTINLAAGKTLRFNRNALNTPVYLLATGDVTITGIINVTGSPGTSSRGGFGGPGGFDGGAPGFGAENPPGAGYGPGGGKGGDNGTNFTSGVGSGSYRTSGSAPKVKNGATYGNQLLFPMVGGSGGGGLVGSPGPGGGGHGGGGAVLIASSTKITLSGQVVSSGWSTSFENTNGSGGAIRLVAPAVVGAGQFNVSGGVGGSGRTRIDTIDRREVAIGGIDVVGGLMQVFASPLPKLSVTTAAGTAITEGAQGPINITLPFNSSPNQTVTIRARDFSGPVPIRVVLAPDSGDPLVYDATIDNTTVNPADVTVNVVMPVNRLVRVNAWTR